MGLKQKIGVCLLTSSLALNSCASSYQIKALQNKVDTLEQKINNITTTNQVRDVDELYLRMIEPTVRVELNTNSSSTTGTGTILYSRKEDNGFVYSYILTAAHVVHTIAEEFSITVYKYSKSQDSSQAYSGEILAVKRLTDLAILEVISEEEFPTANLIYKNRINVPKIFDKVYTVGCPTEDPPLQSSGEITNKRIFLGAGNFWRINAPAKTGNSGGGVYLENTKELIGVFTMLETEEVEHKRKDGRSMTIKNHDIDYPHLGIITNPNAIYDFLEEEDLQFIYDSNFSREECFERREN